MTQKMIRCGKLSISNSSAFTLIAGPCQLENEKHAMDVAEKLKEITQKLGLGLIIKLLLTKLIGPVLKAKEEQD